MKVVGEFNKISKEMLAMIPTLKKGEIKTFQLVTGHKNNFPDDMDGGKERRDHPMLYATWQIPTRDRIKDWHTGDFVDIGVPDTFRKDEVLTVKVFMPGKGEPQFRYYGKFSLSGSKIADVEMYQYLCICNFNLSNEHRDTAEDAIFCELNIVKESETQLSKSDAMLEAMNAAKNMPIEKAQEFASALLWPSFTDEKILKSKVRQYAQEYPVEFNKYYKDPATKVKAEISEAVNADIISFDIVNSTMSMGHTILATLDIRPESNFVEAFYEFTQTSANGKDVIENIRKQVKALKKEVK